MSEALSKSSQETCEDTNSVISSPESGVGATPSVLPVFRIPLDYGQEAAPANRFQSPASEEETRTSGICGPNFTVSSASARLQSSLESRLRVKTDVNGSPEYSLTWKHWAMPSRAPICALRASQRRTYGKGSTGWPTPRAEDSEQTGAHRGNADTLNSASKFAGWPTTAERDWRDGRSNQHGKNARPLNEVAEMAGWATPRVTNNGNIGNPERGTDGKARLEDQCFAVAGLNLEGQVDLAGWHTPDTKPDRPNANSNCVNTVPGLGNQALLAGWTTPNVPNGGRMGTGELYREDGSKRQRSNEEEARLVSGVESGIPAETGSCDGFRLNPRFSLWLMGFPDEWASCGVRAMQSFLRLPRSSSKRSLKVEG